MDDPVCASCHRGLSLEEIERGSFKHLGGRLYCADCVAKMRRVGPITCPQCGAHDTPLYNGSTYTCRKCGAELSHHPQPTKTRTAAPSRKKPVKKCPYCGAVLPVESIKCRYCGSLLTREAHDLEALAQQNLHLRFWLGCCLTASVFLLVILAYALLHRPTEPAEPRAAAVAPAPAPAKASHEPEPDPRLLRELAALRSEIERLKARPTRPRPSPPPRGSASKGRTPSKPAVVSPAPSRPTPKSRRPKPPTATPRPKVAVAPPKAPPTPPKPKAAKPGTAKPKAKPTPPKPAEPKGPTTAQLASAAYPAVAAKVRTLKAGRKYGEAIALCRQFLAAYVDTPHGKRVAADQKALQAQVEQVRNDHVARFRGALQRDDLKAARAVVADLGRHDGPGIREDRERMLAELDAAEHKPQQDKARYLTQWQLPPNAKRLVAELERKGDDNARSHAAKELGRLGHPAALKPLLAAVDDPDWYVSISVIDALARIGDPIALPVVARRTKASFPGIYHRAAIACRQLAGADRKKYAPAWKLVDAPKVAQEVAEALTLISKEPSGVTSRFRIALIDTLALLGTKQAAPAVRSVLQTDDPAVRAAAAAAIKKLTGEDVGPKPSPAPKPLPPKAATPPKPKTKTPPAKPPTRPAKPAARAASLAAKIEPGGDATSIAFRLPAPHGLHAGDKVQLATGGKPVCVVQIVRADATRVVGKVVKLLVASAPPTGTAVTVTLAK